MCPYQERGQIGPDLAHLEELALECYSWAAPGGQSPSKHHGLLHGMLASLGAATPRGIIIVCSAGGVSMRLPERARNCVYHLGQLTWKAQLIHSFTHTHSCETLPLHTPTSTCPVHHAGTVTGTSNLARRDWVLMCAPPRFILRLLSDASHCSFSPYRGPYKPCLTRMS